MKQIISVILSVIFILAAVTPISAVGSSLLTPALKLIAEDTEMIKSGLVSGRISFDDKDFDLAVGRDVESITITALPPASDGTLMYNNAPVTVNQTISASALKYLSFIPTGNCQ